METKEKPPIYFIKNLKKMVSTLDHREIGLLYFFFAALNLAISGILILIVRLELALPGLQFFLGNVDLYNAFFSTHGLSMIFLVIFPINGGFGNYLIPKLIGAKDLYWPRWNNIAFWMLIPGAIAIYIALPNAGWTFYAPLSVSNLSAESTTLALLGILVIGTSSLIASINFILTVLKLRQPGLKLLDVDLFTWSIVFTSIIQIIVTPFITIAILMLILTIFTGASFFNVLQGSGPLFYQHLFWSYSHPAVYIIVLPAMGLASLAISLYCKRKIFGHVGMIYSMAAITLLGTYVWGHHMFTISTSTAPNWFFLFMTFLIAVPSGLKTFNWMGTLWGGNIDAKPPFLLAIGFIVGFILGGFSGIMLSSLPLDIVFHDTYFVVGHFHLIVIGGVISTTLAGILIIYPDMTGKDYNLKLAKIQALIWVPSAILTFFFMSLLGVFGMPRRIADYLGLPYGDVLTSLNLIVTIGAFAQLVALLLFFHNFAWSWKKGKNAENPPLLAPKYWEKASEVQT